VQRTLYEMTRIQAGRNACPSVVIMDSQSVKTTERGGVRGFDAHKRVKGRKRHILVDTSGLLIACRVAPADISDRTSATQLLGGLVHRSPIFVPSSPMPATKVESFRVISCNRTVGSYRSSSVANEHSRSQA
jgi:hypothetical protein